MPKTKIICTIGPSSGSPEIIRKLMENGMNVARLNFSHGTHDEHLEKIQMIRQISGELGKPISILQDLCGPKIRVGTVPEPGIRLSPGETFVLCSDSDGRESDNRVSVSYPDLQRDVRKGDTILLADGMMEVMVTRITENTVFTEVITGGVLTSHKGVNLPTRSIRIPAVTEKDEDDLAFGLSNDVDFVALSFVRGPEDIQKLKGMIRKAGKDTPVIAKIEKHEALGNIDAIIEKSDGIMVARGDLGVEIPLEKVPVIQKMLVKKANRAGKPVIIATQMLRSMVASQRPTRAEATDVANAVLDGADAVMLSEETASGSYPVEAVQFMVRIAENAEENFPHDQFLKQGYEKNVAESVAYASCILADHLNASAIVATTRSGFTARQVSRFRPRPLLIAPSPDKATVRRLTLNWGCLPVFVPDTKNTDERIENAARSALGTGNVSEGDLIVITTGHPVWAAGTTNMVRVKKL